MEQCPVIFDGKRISTHIYDRAALTPGKKYSGPAIVTEYSATTAVPPAMSFHLDSARNLLIDITMTAEQMKEPIPADDTHKHFGGGQTEAMVTLPEGKHTLQLLLADWTHIPHVPPVISEPITITVR